MEHSSVESCVRGCPVYKAQTQFVLAYLTIIALFSSTVNDRYWPLIFGCASQPPSLLFSLPHGTA